jgi:glycosyltransferase involved in cell wall biosynthesis
LRIGYLTSDSVNEGVGQSQILPVLKKLAQKGVAISLVSFEKNKQYSNIYQNLVTNGIDWNPQEFGSFGLGGGVMRAAKLFSVIGEYDLIHARSDLPAVAAFLRHGQTPYLWDVRSLWALQRYETSEKNLNSKAEFILGSKLEKIAAKNCSGFSTLTRSILPYLLDKYPSLPKLHETNPTVVDLDTFSVSELNLNQITCLIVGTMNSFYDIDRTNKILLNLAKFINLKIVWARGQESTTAKSAICADQVLELSHEEMPKSIRNSSFGIAIGKFNQNEWVKAVSPTKVAEFLASGRPVIVSAGIGDLDYQIREFNAGIILQGSETPKEIANALMALLEDPSTVERCRALAEKYYSLDNTVSKYLSLYKRILD